MSVKIYMLFLKLYYLFIDFLGRLELLFDFLDLIFFKNHKKIRDKKFYLWIDSGIFFKFLQFGQL